MTEPNHPGQAEDGFVSNLLGKARELGESAKDLAGEALDKAKDFAEDLPENAKKLADDTVAAVKDFAQDFPENARKVTEDTVAAVKDFAQDLPGTAKKVADDTVAGVKDLLDGDAPKDPNGPTPSDQPTQVGYG